MVPGPVYGSVLVRKKGQTLMAFQNPELRLWCRTRKPDRVLANKKRNDTGLAFFGEMEQFGACTNGVSMSQTEPWQLGGVNAGLLS